VVAGHQDHLAADPERPADHAEDRLGYVHRMIGRPLEQLHDIPEQHKPLDALDHLKQPVERLRLRQDVVP
jgi:hypothetical protein